MKTLSAHPVFYWIFALIISLSAIMLISSRWSASKPEYKHDGITIPVTNPVELDALLASGDTKEFKNNRIPKRIPTGFFIQSFSFVNANDVNINGYIWMKFPKGLVQGFKEEFIFPEEVSSNATKSEKIYELEQGDHKLIGWYFDVIVRQSFDYSKYPLDFHSVWLRIWSKEFTYDEKIILVPDFESYDKESLANNLFGLDVDIVPSGWKILETFFSYKRIPYDTSFGFEQSSTDQKYTELFFNIGIHRNFVDAFIINLVPLFFVILLLFALVMTVSGEEERKSNFGFNTTNTVGICASFLFVVILLHIQIRQQFAGSELVYIEYFYLIVYLVIIMTAFNSFVFSMGRLKYLNVIHFRDNLLVKASYWPVVLWMMAGVTWYKV